MSWRPPGTTSNAFVKAMKFWFLSIFPVILVGLVVSGRQTICERLKGRIGFEFNGGFAEYVAVPEDCLIPKPPAPLLPAGGGDSGCLGHLLPCFGPPG